MGSVLRLLVYLGVGLVGLLLAIEVQAHRQARGRAGQEIGRASAESTATIAPPPTSGAPAVTPTRASATRRASNGTTALGIAASFVVVVLTGWVLYRLAG